MSSKKASIPVKPLRGEFHTGIAIAKISFDKLQSYEELEAAHRHDSHVFLLQEKGTSRMEIDFKHYEIKKSNILYIHPNQVHRSFQVKNTATYVLSINSENIKPELLKQLEEIVPAEPLPLTAAHFSIVQETISLCLHLFERKRDKLYSSLLKDSCNVLVGLMISQYLDKPKQRAKPSRFDSVNDAFRLALEKNFTVLKRPSDYAEQLNISVPYLNECSRNATGFSASYHIQQRVILEAKRFLYHSNKSVKEIAAELGYKDYAYFSRLFSKATGMTALAFRNKNLV